MNQWSYFTTLYFVEQLKCNFKNLKSNVKYHFTFFKFYMYLKWTRTISKCAWDLPSYIYEISKVCPIRVTGIIICNVK